MTFRIIEMDSSTKKMKRRNRMRKRILSVALALSVITTLIPANYSNAAKPQKPVLSQSGISMTIGTKKTIKLKKAPALTKKKLKLVKWSSSNKKVATVAVKGRKKTKAVIKAVASGKAIIKVKYGGKSYKCTVVVQEAIQDSTVSVPTTEKNTEKVTTEKSTEQERTTEKSTEQDNATEEPSTEHVHKYGEYKTLTKATCITPGVEVRTCSCGEIDSREIKALGHDWDNGTVTAKSTCTIDGKMVYSCSRCNTTKEETIKASGHQYDSGVVTTAPTYTNPGVKTFTCGVCGNKKTEAIPMLNETEHAWDNGVVTKKATCSTEGVRTFTCANCGGTKTESIAKLDHTWNDPIVLEQSTCAKEGTKSYTCSVCGETKTEKIPVTSTHSWGSYTTTKAATCGEVGQRTRTCTRCKKVEVSEIAATGKHSYDAGIVTIQPTCATQGVKTYTCTVCGNKKTEAIAKTTTHTYDEGVVTTEPTCGKSGVRTYTCAVCGDQKTEEIATTGHQYDDYGVYLEATYSRCGKEYPKCSNCGKFQIDASKVKLIPCKDAVSGIKRIEKSQGYNSITGGGSYKYKIFENGTIPSSIYFLQKDTKQQCRIEVSCKPADGRNHDVEPDDIDVFTFTIYSGNDTVTKTYSYAELSDLFTPENQLSVLQKIYGEESGALYNNNEQDLIYNKGGYAGSIDTALIKIPIDYEYIYESNGETSNTHASGAIYINSMSLAMICDDMGYVCNGGFHGEVSYAIK